MSQNKLVLMTAFLFLIATFLINVNFSYTGYSVLDSDFSPSKILNDVFVIGNESYPVWALFSSFIILISLFFIIARHLSFLENNERKGLALISAFLVSVIMIILTPVVNWIILVTPTLGFFLPIIVFIFLLLLIFFYKHKAPSQGMYEISPPKENLSKESIEIQQRVPQWNEYHQPVQQKGLQSEVKKSKTAQQILNEISQNNEQELEEEYSKAEPKTKKEARKIVKSMKKEFKKKIKETRKQLKKKVKEHKRKR